jgi:chemotaxis protein methyltransferase CheR
MRHPLLVLGNDLTVISTNRSFYQVFQVDPEETIGVKLFDLGDGQWNILKLNELLDSIVVEDTVFENFLVEHKFPLIGPKKFILDARRLKRQGNKDFLILLAIEELTTQAN